jgi:hypothetical protein
MKDKSGSSDPPLINSQRNSTSRLLSGKVAARFAMIGRSTAKDQKGTARHCVKLAASLARWPD